MRDNGRSGCGWRGHGWGRVVAAAVVASALVTLAGACSAFGGDDETTATTVPNGVRIIDLEPGTCFQAPANTDVRAVEERPCDEDHDAEAYAVFALPAGPDAPYPGGSQVQSVSQQGCQDRFADYVGQPYEDSAYYFTAITPTRKSWEDRADRRVLCAVISSNQDPLDTSVRAGGAGGDG